MQSRPVPIYPAALSTAYCGIFFHNAAELIERRKQDNDDEDDEEDNEEDDEEANDEANEEDDEEDYVDDDDDKDKKDSLLDESKASESTAYLGLRASSFDLSLPDFSRSSRLSSARSTTTAQLSGLQ